MLRLDRVLANARVGSRSEVKKLVKEKRVKVNGILAKSSDMRVDENNDKILVDDILIKYEKYVYFMLNKPQGYISATEGKNCPTVLDLIHEDYRGMFPCGRLDKDTEGLLLITNDGPLAHELLSPKKHVEKEYYVEHTLPLADQDVQRIQTGIVYNGVTYKPAVYKKISDTSCHLVIQEGKYHEIKFIMNAVGDKVVYLKRIRMKNLVLDESLKPGEYRPLTADELEDLKLIAR
ncbi:MAG: rRNA pseudouridine synthase [Erysipelotrichaceae bacterium]|nr:rRNA pseudouridine synthase [Erysipelotrichaceae bacterium]